MSVWVKWSRTTSVWMAVALSACGGGGEGSEVGVSENPPPAAASATRLTNEGIWGWEYSDTFSAVFVVPAQGDSWGLLIDSTSGSLVLEVARGRMLAFQGQAISSQLSAVGAVPAQKRAIGLNGGFTPMASMNLTLTPNNYTGELQYDPSYDVVVPLSGVATTYEADLYADGYKDSFEVSVASDGTVALASVTPGFEHCTGSGRLQPQGSTAIFATRLDFTGAGCLLPDGVTIEGVAQYDGVLRKLIAFGMDRDASVALLMDANR